jgi:anti-sigma B factor antagonist
LIEPCLLPREDGKGLQMPRESDQTPVPRDERAASDNPLFGVRAERVDEVYRLTISGELDLATRDTLNDELERAEASEPRRILLDLTSLTFIDSIGIAVLVAAHQRSAMNGTQLRVVSADGQVRDMLELTGVMEALDLAE